MEPLPEPDQVQALVERATALPALGARKERLSRLVADYRRNLVEQDAFASIALVGATGAGKSTLLNALAGQPIAQEGVDRPTSRRATVYAPEDASVARLEALGADVRRYSVRAGLPWLGQVFIDTPDLNSIAREHQDIARKVLEGADVAVVVLHRGSVAEATQMDFLAEFAQRRRLVFVLNFADLLGESARAQLSSQLTRLAGERLGLSPDEVQVFSLSATAAQRVRDASPGFLALVETLRELAGQAATERLRTGHAAVVLEELRGHARGAVAHAQGDLEDIAQALAGGLEKASETLSSDFQTRLEQARAHLSSEVRREASARWWGPAAWWMRLTMLGAGGLGAASLVARANLPAGLAVAAASTVLSRVQQHARAGATERRVVQGSSEGGELAPVARAGLAEARAAAHQRGWAPADVGLPDSDEVLETLAALRTSSWEFTTTRAVPEAVHRWWRWARWVLLPLINLPLLALFGHVAYRVVDGYLREHYLPGSYFLNAGALAAVLSVAGGVLASVSLSGAARRAQVAGARHFRERLAGWAERSVTQVRQALAEPREAAEALSRLGPAAGVTLSTLAPMPTPALLSTGGTAR